MSSLRDDVLGRTDIVDLVSKYVDIKKAGKNRLGLCPFHKEKSPSFTVAEDKQIFKCFGCGKGWNAITFHMEIERIDFWDSLQMLAKDASIDISSYQKDPERNAAAKSEKEKQKLINKRTNWFFQQNLPWSKAEKYIKEKRWLSQETIETFALWYAPDSYNDLIALLKTKWFSDQDIIDAWLAKLWKSWETYSFFRNRLTFPIHDHIWNVVGFGARALDPDQNPKYLNTTETAVYNKSQILFGLDKAKNHLKSFDYLIIVEWYMDVIALYQYWLPIGIATCGTALTPQHTKLIHRHTEHLLFAFDNDDAWFEASIRWLKVAYEQDLFPKILQFPDEYKDVDEWLWSWTIQINDSEQWKEKLKESSIDGFARAIEKYLQKYDLQNPVERKKVIQLVFELLVKIDDYSILQMYFTQLTTAVWVHEEQLWKQFRQRVKKSSVRKNTYHDDAKEQRPDSSSKIEEKYLLGSLMYKDFALTLWCDEKIFKKYSSVLAQLATFFPRTILAEVYNQDLSWWTKEKLIEAEMFREVQVADLDKQKVTAVVHKFLHQQIYKLQRVVMKSKSLTHEHKQDLLTRIRSL